MTADDMVEVSGAAQKVGLVGLQPHHFLGRTAEPHHFSITNVVSGRQPLNKIVVIRALHFDAMMNCQVVQKLELHE